VALRKCLSSTINTAIARRPSSAGTCLGTKSVAVPDGVACVTKDLKLVACGIRQLLALWNSGGQSGRWRCPLFRPRQLGSINSPVPGKPFARQLGGALGQRATQIAVRQPPLHRLHHCRRILRLAHQHVLAVHKGALRRGSSSGDHRQPMREGFRKGTVV